MRVASHVSGMMMQRIVRSDTLLTTTEGGNVTLTGGPVDLEDVTLPIGGSAA